VWRSVHGTVLVLPVSDHEVRVLSGASADLWHLLAPPLTIEEAAHLLAGKYDMPPDEIVQQIAPVLDDLSAQRVLHRMATA
jgi:Coenzyme PQQ synthesis protein D (PqqD)